MQPNPCQVPGHRVKEKTGDVLPVPKLKGLLEGNPPNEGASADAWIQVSLRGQGGSMGQQVSPWVDAAGQQGPGRVAESQRL